MNRRKETFTSPLIRLRHLLPEGEGCQRLVDSPTRPACYSSRVGRALRVGCFAIAIGVLLLVAATTVFFLGRGRTPSIPGDRSIASLERVRIGGVDQWLLIRGRDRSNPVLLFLHGGPGMPAMFLAHACERELEGSFVVANWDRRGAGKSYGAGANAGALDVRRVLDDTFEVSRLLRQRFGQERIYLVAHSWGTYLGLLAIREHPEYYSAYIGMGQMAGALASVREIQRDFVLRCATRANDIATIEMMRRRAPIDEDMLFKCHGELWKSTSFLPILLTGLRAPEYTFLDALHVKPAANRVNHEMKYNVEPRPLLGEVQAVDVPVFFLLGRHDYNTPSSVASEYLSRLSAPLKSLTWFEQSAHFPFFEEPRAFTRAMLRANRLVHDYRRAQELLSPQTGSDTPRARVEH
jgi:pimeloyl-ACP methyl ester carboxylesterase